LNQIIAKSFSCQSIIFVIDRTAQPG